MGSANPVFPVVFCPVKHPEPHGGPKGYGRVSVKGTGLWFNDLTGWVHSWTVIGEKKSDSRNYVINRLPSSPIK